MEQFNLYFAWCWFLLGLIAGAVAGLWFHAEQWLGGYGSWRRRLMRLGHIAFFGTGLLNLCFALSVRYVDGWQTALTWSSMSLMVGGVTMPTVCYLAAFRQKLRHLFVIPVLSLIVGTGLFAIVLLMDHFTGG